MRNFPAGRTLLAVAIVAVSLSPCAAGAADARKIVFLTNWKAQAEHGGYYQASAKGLYRQHGLDVQIRMGGPGIDSQQLLAAGAADMAIGPNNFVALNLVQADAPVVAVAAIFQKDPLVLLTHATSSVQSLADMKGKPVMLSKASVSSVWRWLKAKHGFADEQLRPYSFNTAPFAISPDAVQQGYVTAEPFKIKKETGLDTKVFMLANAGYQTYASIVLVQRRLIDASPQAVQDFVNASIEGWYDYLYGDPTPGNVLIKKDNPDMDDASIAEGIAKMKEYGIVDSGDARTSGIGVMTADRWKAFFEDMAATGLYPASLDFMKAFTTQFVGKNHAAAMRPRDAR